MKRVLRFMIMAALVLSISVELPAQVKVQGVNRVVLTVRDIESETAFFVNVLTFERVSAHERTLGKKVLERDVELRLGDEVLELNQFPESHSRSIPGDARANDRSFQHVAIIVRDMDKAYKRLRTAGVRHASSYPQTLPESIKGAGGIRAFYFRDPEGHFLEVLQFPADKGAAKWHRDGSDLFMGIDHTAIVVGSTDASVAFYHDQLGMHVAGESENFGSEQEHLNGVFGAHLRITALRGDSGPGIELLEYLAPSDGREYPTNTRREDLLHWETRLAIDVELTTAQKKLNNAKLRDDKSLELQDPDGHVMVLIAEQTITTGAER